MEDAARQSIFEEKEAEKVIGDFKEEPAPGPGGMSIDLGFLFAETGEGSIDDYVDHPMNFNSSKGLAQVLRGLTGMFFDLKLAIIDIVLGSFKMVMEGKAEK